MKVCRILIFGQVHGVGFRKFVRDHARKLGLVGWVRNLPEGTVEIEVGDDIEKIEELIKQCKKGPFLSEVKAVDIEWMEKNFPYEEFVLRHDIE